MAHSPEKNALMLALTGADPGDYYIDALLRRYQVILQRVNKVLAVDASGQEGPESIQHLYVLADIGLWLGKPNLIPEEFFTLFGNFEKAKEKLVELKQEFSKIEAQLGTLPGRLESVRHKVAKFVHAA